MLVISKIVVPQFTILREQLVASPVAVELIIGLHTQIIMAKGVLQRIRLQVELLVISKTVVHRFITKMERLAVRLVLVEPLIDLLIQIITIKDVKEMTNHLVELPVTLTYVVLNQILLMVIGAHVQQVVEVEQKPDQKQLQNVMEQSLILHKRKNVIKKLVQLN